MIAAYVTTRMVEMLGQPLAQANVVAKILAVVTIIVAALATFDLLARGHTGPTFPQ